MNNSKKIGNEGERQVANVLSYFPISDFKLYNNVMFKTRRGTREEILL